MQEEILSKNRERKEVQVQKTESELWLAISFSDWNHIILMFTISKIKTIKRIKSLQNCELSDLMGNKLQHNPNKVLSNYQNMFYLKIKNYYQ